MQQQVVIRTRDMQTLEARLGRPIAEILRDLYVAQGMTVDEVGDELGVTAGTVSRWLGRCDIEARPRGGQRAPAA